MLRNQIGKSHFALRIVWKQIVRDLYLKSMSTLTTIASYTKTRLAGATFMPHSKNGLHIKMGLSSLTDRQILKIFFSQISDSERHFIGFSDPVIPAECGFIFLFGPDYRFCL